MADEEIVEGEEAQGSPAGAEFVPEATHKPKSDVYTLILILTFIAFLAGCIVAGRECWEHYDVQFWAFTKHPPKSGEVGGGPAPTTEPAPAPAPSGGAGEMKK